MAEDTLILAEFTYPNLPWCRRMMQVGILLLNLALTRGQRIYASWRTLLFPASTASLGTLWLLLLVLLRTRLSVRGHIGACLRRLRGKCSSILCSRRSRGHRSILLLLLSLGRIGSVPLQRHAPRRIGFTRESKLSLRRRRALLLKQAAVARSARRGGKYSRVCYGSRDNTLIWLARRLESFSPGQWKALKTESWIGREDDTRRFWRRLQLITTAARPTIEPATLGMN